VSAELERLLGKNVRGYWDACCVIAQREKVARAAFEAVLSLDDTFVRTRVENLGGALDDTEDDAERTRWLRFYASKLEAEQRHGVAEQLIWCSVHMAPRIDKDVRDGTLFASALFAAIARFDHKGFRSEASRAAGYCGGEAFDAALCEFVDGLEGSQRRRFQTLVKLANARRG